MMEEKMAVVRPSPFENCSLNTSIMVSYDDTYHIISAGLARIKNNGPMVPHTFKINSLTAVVAYLRPLFFRASC